MAVNTIIISTFKLSSDKLKEEVALIGYESAGIMDTSKNPSNIQRVHISLFQLPDTERFKKSETDAYMENNALLFIHKAS